MQLYSPDGASQRQCGLWCCFSCFCLKIEEKNYFPFVGCCLKNLAIVQKNIVMPNSGLRRAVAPQLPPTPCWKAALTSWLYGGRQAASTVSLWSRLCLHCAVACMSVFDAVLAIAVSRLTGLPWYWYLLTTESAGVNSRKQAINSPVQVGCITEWIRLWNAALC